MKCIIVDDEPIAREGLEVLIGNIPELKLVGNFDSADSAAEYMDINSVDLIFLDIEMPEINGLEFARTIPKNTLVIFTTAYSEYALDSYEVDATDYLVKPIEYERFKKAVDKAIVYHSMLVSEEKEEIESDSNFIFVKSERRYFKVNYDDILFIEGLKDYVIIQTENKRIITKLYLRTIFELLPAKMFFRINKSYIVNLEKIDSFDNNDVFIGEHEIGIGATHREEFYKIFMSRKA
ncbi:LytR/AlgR family response regulator transcription factor [Bacteroides pyogenes]|uniref:LytR/AlgR family response regulator transcription factor n=1 Tax=Bacteroides pyogenes TaxID=310300 RepID=UPI001F31F802|nr:LytTR family DNA-binding domain-containing protein [Bacteroides pyogenes]MCE9108239.1 LytTR family DNA-binding domain-containing protein [Bacteroides pyogenes]